ncbi:zinc finger protein ush isoform X2 [Drosophila teissieri]|uniref:zinc finger protein ush isoform X2 n=1 Tax=Drosophila teissieri TaxID=7243 RepID=UPI001CB9F1F5|nr:zinc finger protein ush isoform X2 [Drosophila teissieri]
MLSSNTRGDCSDTTEEMTVDSRDSKDLSAQEMGEQKQQQMEDHLEDQLDNSRDPQNNNNNIDEDDDEDADFEQPENANPQQDQDLGETEMEQDHDLQQEEQQELPANSPSTPPRSPSSPPLIPKLEQPATPPSEAEASPCPSPSPSPSPSPCPTPKYPKVRLNALLASDPALKPDAKELTLPDARLLAPPPLVKPETQAQPDVAEPLLKPARFMCLPCGIAFSSPSTLEAHQAYYCSHRIKDTDEAGSDKSGAGGSAAAAGEAAGLAGGSSEPPAKMARTGKQYGCTQCSYSADKKVSLNRHMRMHQTSPAAPTLVSLPSLLQNGIAPPGVTPNPMEDSSSQQTDRYCSHCDIRFNNIKTYRAHKQHYCSSRRPEGQLTPKPAASPGAGSGPGSSGASMGVSAQAAAPGKMSPQARNKTPTPAMVAVAAAAAAAAASLQATPHSHPPFLALPTHPIIIVPCSLIRAASFIPGPLPTPNSGIVNPETTCFTVDNGTIKPLATALIGASLEPERPSAPSSAAEATEAKSSPPEPKRKEAGQTRESAPLDLSLRRSPITLNSLSLRQRQLRNALLDVEEVLLAGAGTSKENAETPRGGGSVTPEQIVCAPSLPSSPSMSPSPKRRAISPRSSGAGSASSMSPPGLNVAVPHLLDMRSMLPADFGLSESLLAKTNPELALKLAAAAAAAAVAGSSGAAAFPPSPLPAQASSGNPGSGGPAGGAQQPQIYVKKGVSKCMECNIVFCKYENYLAHKQHYCSARSQEGASEVDVKSAVSPSIAGAGGLGSGGAEAASSVETTPVAYQQLICAACGIKYTSLDNLRAHQNYYCPKGGAAAAPAAAPTDPGQLAMAKEKCGKCKTLHEIGLPCPPPVANHLAAPPANPQPASNSLNKCPVCGVVSPTAALAKKHMEMHGTVKAYRCSICQYKGNTLRGMRTHIRTHFDKKTSDVNEELYMTCIFEEDVTALSQELVPSTAASATSVHDSMDHPSQTFNCDYCNYVSTYKGNVLRHMKLMHPHVAINSPSISPDTRDQDVNSNPTPNQHSNSDGSNGEAASFHIKSEPLDPPPTVNLVHENNNSPIATPHIKAEPIEVGADAAAGGLVPPMTSPLGNSSSMAAAAAAAAEVMKKYCSTCDISFNYVKTYLAHKQFYCKNKPIRPEASDSPSPNHLGGGVAVGLGLGGLVGGHGQQKNKENLQEAAI